MSRIGPLLSARAPNGVPDAPVQQHLMQPAPDPPRHSPRSDGEASRRARAGVRSKWKANCPCCCVGPCKYANRSSCADDGQGRARRLHRYALPPFSPAAGGGQATCRGGQATQAVGRPLAFARRPLLSLALSRALLPTPPLISLSLCYARSELRRVVLRLTAYHTSRKFHR
jgi:hypothetical protein